MARIFLLVALLALSAGPVLAAGCQPRIDALAAKVAQVEPERTRQLVAFDIKRATKELGEGDEDECLEAVEHAEDLIAHKSN